MNRVFLFLVLLSIITITQKISAQILFNGVSLDGWEVIDFTGHGSVSVADSCVIIRKGLGISGIKWTKDYPKTNWKQKVSDGFGPDIPEEEVLKNAQTIICGNAW